METYEPAEDSYLLAEVVKRHAFGKVLDMGTGSGIQAETALKSRRVKSVTAADINKDCRKNLNRKIRFIHSNLFGRIPKQKFDTIIFNPPYLPQDRGIKDARIYGGKKGHEIIERFLDSCGSYLSDNGIILLLFSNLTKKDRIDEIIEENGFEKEELSRKELPFLEMLHVYKIKKSKLLKELERKGIGEAKLFTKGNRGVIYVGKLKGKNVAVKAKRKESAAKGRISNEAKWLKALNKRRIGPKIIATGSNYFIYEFVEGAFIIDYLDACNRKNAIAVIKGILQQCRALDELKLNKEEMLRPYRHVIVRRGKAVMIDFERCKRVSKPKNVTQFCQFLAGGRVGELLKSKNITINRRSLLEAAKNYKNKQTHTNFIRVKDEIQ